MKRKYFSFDETYELDNVYNCEDDERYGSSDEESSVWYN